MSKITVGGLVKLSQATFTRPADTVTYTAGDVVANSTSAAVPMTFPGCAHVSKGTGLVQGAILVDSANQALKLDADLFLFSLLPTAFGNDNAAFTPTDAVLQTCIGVISFPATSARNGDATSGGGGNAICQIGNLSIPFKCDGSTADIYGVLVARNAYVPISASPFYITLAVLQD